MFPRIIKPTWRVTLNQSHPLARGLVFATILGEGAGQPYEIITGVKSTNGATWKPTPYGIGIQSPASGTSGFPNFGDNTTWHPNTLTGTGLTWVIHCNPVNSATAFFLMGKHNNSTSAQITFIANAINDAASAGGLCWVFVDNAGVAKFRILNSDGTTGVDGKWHQYGVSVAPLAASGQLYLDGLPRTTTINSAGGVPNYTGTDPLTVGGDASIGASNCGVAYAYYWLRQLSNQEMALLNEQPFGMFAPVNQRSFFFFTSPGTTTTTTTTTTTSTTTTTTSTTTTTTPGSVSFTSACCKGTVNGF